MTPDYLGVVDTSGSPGKSKKHDSSVLFTVYIFFGYEYFSDFERQPVDNSKKSETVKNFGKF